MTHLLLLDRRLIGLATVSFLVLMALTVVTGNDPERRLLPSVCLVALETSFAVLCWLRYKRATHLRYQWALLCVAAAFRVSSFVMDAFDQVAGRFIPQLPVWSVTYTDFVSFSALIPFLLLISLPTGQRYPKLFFAIDALQAALMGYLAYVTLFEDMAFPALTGMPSDAALSIIYSRIAIFYGAFAVFMACATVVRFFASTDPDEAGFYRIQAICAFVSLCLSLSRYVHWADIIPWMESLSKAPVLIACWLIGRLAPESQKTASQRTKHPLARLLNLASPIFFSVPLFGLGLYVARYHAILGTVFASCSMLLYCIRSSNLQLHYERAQEALKAARDRMQELSLLDSLTGVANRRCFERTLSAAWSRAVRENRTLSLLLIDIDFFKQLNDRKGYALGDECLIRVAAALRNALSRPADLLARYGGEEFAAILPETAGTDAMHIAETMQQLVGQLQIPHETEIGSFVTVSIGIATHSVANFDTENSLLRGADLALYKAKEKGRNCFVLYL